MLTDAQVYCMTFILWSIYFDHHLPLKPSIGKRRKQSCIPNNISSYLELRAFARAFSYISETTYLCFYFCIRYWWIVRDITIFARSWCIAISPGIELVCISKWIMYEILLYEINESSRCFILLSASKLWSKSEWEYRYTLDNNIRMRFWIGCAIASISWFQHTTHIIAYVSQGFFDNSHRVYLVNFRTPGTGSLYICKSIGALRLSQLFSLPDIYPFTMIAIRFFGLTLKWFIVCYLSAIRCLTYAESPYCRLRLSDYATICVLVIGCYTECSPWTRI